MLFVHIKYIAFLLFRIIISFALLSQVVVVIADDSTEMEAISNINKFHAGLLMVMKDAESLGYEGRYQILSGIIEVNFDTPFISKIILSRYWKELTEMQRLKFIDQFKRLSVAIYANNFDGYSGETFITKTVEKLPKNRLLVKTEIQGKDAVKLDYFMHLKEGKWHIISVRADGVNDIAVRRSEYSKVIEKKGFENLIQNIENQIHQLSIR